MSGWWRKCTCIKIYLLRFNFSYEPGSSSGPSHLPQALPAPAFSGNCPNTCVLDPSRENFWFLYPSTLAVI